MKSKYFRRKEFECSCGCGFNTVDVDLLDVVEDVREHFDTPVTINSACRCVSHNHSVGGSAKSKHLLGIAADIVVLDVSPERVYNYLDNKYPNSKGLGSYSNFTHIDVRDTKARWKG